MDNFQGSSLRCKGLDHPRHETQKILEWEKTPEWGPGAGVGMEQWSKYRKALPSRLLDR